MPRKRQLDPDFFEDEEIAEFPFEGRLFYQGSWCYCEDTGVFEVKFKTLKAKIFPHDNLDVKPLYEKIRDNGKYIEYLVNGAAYAFIKGFHKRQVIQYPSTSYLPLPPEPFLSLIPEKIRKLNKSSMSIQSALSDHSKRISRDNRIESIEIENLKKLFTSKDKLKNHLKGRGFEAQATKSIIKQHFSNLK